MGTLPLVAGRYGNSKSALQFSPNNFVQVPSSPAFDLQQWTISAIVRFDTFQTTDCQVSKIIQRGHQYGGDYICLEVNDNAVDNSCGIYTANGQQPFGFAAGSTYSFSTNPSGHLNTRTWYCITSTYGNDTLKTYVDGVLNSSAYMPNQYSTGAGGYPSGESLTIGMGQGSGGSTYWFRGAIDEVAIYNMPLSAAEVSNLCQHPNAVNGKTGGIQQGIGMPYPNPANGVLTIPVKNISGQASICVKGIDGRTVSNTDFRLQGADTLLQVNTADLVPGLYILEVVSGTEKVARHFLKL